MFALSRGKGQSCSRLGPVRPTLREGAPGGRRGRRGPWGGSQRPGSYLNRSCPAVSQICPKHTITPGGAAQDGGCGGRQGHPETSTSGLGECVEHADRQQLGAHARSPETLKTVGPDPGGGHTGRCVQKSCSVTLGSALGGSPKQASAQGTLTFVWLHREAGRVGVPQSGTWALSNESTDPNCQGSPELPNCTFANVCVSNCL